MLDRVVELFPVGIPTAAGIQIRVRKIGPVRQLSGAGGHEEDRGQ
jgi:hypothetical protein